MNRIRICILFSFLCCLSFFQPLASQKNRLWIEGAENLIPLLRIVFTNNQILEGAELKKRIKHLSQLVEQADKKPLSDGEEVIVKKVGSLVKYLKDVRKWEKRGKAPSSHAEKIKERELAAIRLLCNRNNIFLRQGKNGKCLPRN